MQGYFENFPLIRYGDVYARNIIQRAALTEEVLKNQYVFYPYDIQSDLRADLMAHYYYNNSYSEWIFYLANNIIDPYYQWYLNDEQLNNLIEKKYGSLINSTTKIHRWQVNWLGDDTTITTQQYNTLVVDVVLGINQKRYWAPIFNNSDIVGYKRKQLDLNVDTNVNVKISSSTALQTNFIVGEKVYQTSGTLISGYGFVGAQLEDGLMIKNVFGNLQIGEVLIGEESGSTFTVSDLFVVSRSFPQQESQYWEPISFFDYEIEKNEQSKSINVIDKQYVKNVHSSLKSVLENV